MGLALTQLTEYPYFPTFVIKEGGYQADCFVDAKPPVDWVIFTSFLFALGLVLPWFCGNDNVCSDFLLAFIVYLLITIPNFQ